MNTHMHTRTYACTHVRMHTRTHAYTHACTHTQMKHMWRHDDMAWHTKPHIKKCLILYRVSMCIDQIVHYYIYIVQSCYFMTNDYTPRCSAPTIIQDTYCTTLHQNKLYITDHSGQSVRMHVLQPKI